MGHKLNEKITFLLYFVFPMTYKKIKFKKKGNYDFSLPVVTRKIRIHIFDVKIHLCFTLFFVNIYL